jgi:hypothetical protein
VNPITNTKKGNQIMGNVLANFQGNDVGLNNFQSRSVLRLPVPNDSSVSPVTGIGPNGLVIATLVISNDDGDPQNATVVLSHGRGQDPQGVGIGKVDIRVAGGGAQAVVVSGFVRDFGQGDFVEVVAATFNGVAKSCFLFTISADTIFA